MPTDRVRRRPPRRALGGRTAHSRGRRQPADRQLDRRHRSGRRRAHAARGATARDAQRGPGQRHRRHLLPDDRGVGSDVGRHRELRRARGAEPRRLRPQSADRRSAMGVQERLPRQSDGTGNGARLRRYHSVPSVHRVGDDLGRPLAVPPRPPRRGAVGRRPRRARGLFGSSERAGARHEAGRHRSGLRAVPDRRRESRDLRLPRRLHSGAGAGRVDVPESVAPRLRPARTGARSGGGARPQSVQEPDRRRRGPRERNPRQRPVGDLRRGESGLRHGFGR